MKAGALSSLICICSYDVDSSRVNIVKETGLQAVGILTRKDACLAENVV